MAGFFSSVCAVAHKVFGAGGRKAQKVQGKSLANCNKFYKKLLITGG